MSKTAYDYMDWPGIEAIVYGEEASPKDVMAPRLTADGVLIQGFFPEAEQAEVLTGKKTYLMEQEDETGYFAVLLQERKIPEYRFRITRSGKTEEFADAYAFPGQITEEEEKAFCAGVYYHAYKKLGAHPVTIGGCKGTFFAVWAPNAMRVSVVGDFNDWDGRRHPMHRMPRSGIFELFIPGVKDGSLYKYEIKCGSDEIKLKADPYAACVEAPPALASVVPENSAFPWGDDGWMDARRKYGSKNLPISIYETRLSDWESPEELAARVKDLRYTHVEFHPVMASPDEKGSEYNTFSYFAADRRLGGTEAFREVTNILHREGIGVILDWIPSHFPRHAEGLELFDGTALYENPDPAMSVHPVWGTRLYNYESPMVADFLISNAFYWIEEFHVDGLRLDDVDAMLYLDYGREYGQWTPNLYGTNENLAAVEFLKHLNSILHKKFPGVLIVAQEDGLWPELTDSVENDHMGFDFKWNNNWSRDFLDYLFRDPVERKFVHDQLTLSMLYAYSEHYILTLGMRDVGSSAEFSEKLPGDAQQRQSGVREAYVYQMLHPGCKMTAPGKDLSPEMTAFLRDLNAFYQAQPALYKRDDEFEGFEWIQLMKYEENVLAFLRKTDRPEETLLAIVNFSTVPYEGYQVGVPFYGKYKEIFNSDRKEYGGAGTVNPRAKTCRAAECDEREYSVKFRIPALGAAIFSCTPDPKTEKNIMTRKTAPKRTTVKNRTAAGAAAKGAAARKAESAQKEAGEEKLKKKAV